jgi:hypothetical protein
MLYPWHPVLCAIQHVFEGVMARTVLTIFCFFSAISGFSQEAVHEIWPEVKVYYNFNDKFRLYFLGTATRTADAFNYTDGSLGLHLDYFAYPFFRKGEAEGMHRGDLIWFRVGLVYDASTPNAPDQHGDNIFLTQSDVKFHLPERLVFTVRNRLDWRVSNNVFSPRYRPRLRLDRDFKTTYLIFTAFVYGEYCFDFGATPKDRLRLYIGSAIKVSDVVTFESFVMHQFDNNVVGSVNAMAFTFKIYLRHNNPKQELMRTAE